MAKRKPKASCAQRQARLALTSTTDIALRAFVKNAGESTAQAMLNRKCNLNCAAMCVYRRSMPELGDQYQAEIESTPIPVGYAFLVGENANELAEPDHLTACHQIWQNATGLPPLDSDENWRIVALQANANSDLILHAITNGDRQQLKQLVELITAKVVVSEPRTELDQHEMAILQVLQQQPNVAMFQVAIAEAAMLDRGTVGTRLARLRKIGLVKHGRNGKGSLLTNSGLCAVDRFPTDSP